MNMLYSNNDNNNNNNTRSLSFLIRTGLFLSAFSHLRLERDTIQYNNSNHTIV